MRTHYPPCSKTASIFHLQDISQADLYACLFQTQIKTSWKTDYKERERERESVKKG